MKVQGIDAVLLQIVDIQLILHLFPGLEQLRIGVGLASNEVVKRVGGPSFLEGAAELIGDLAVDILLRAHHIPSNQYKLLVVVHIVGALPEAKVLVLHHVVDQLRHVVAVGADGRGEG